MPKHCELIMHPDRLEVVRDDGRTPTLSEIKLKDEWERYLLALAAIMRNKNKFNILKTKHYEQPLL